MDIDILNSYINGKIIGANDFFTDFTGRFTFLNDAKKGDIVIRHNIDGKGIEIASSKEISCLITQTPKEGAYKKAKELNFPLIVVDKIEIANAYALSWTIKKYSPNSRNIVVTGTNGKSTTSHLIYHILKSSGYKVFTNTDSESEFNTLIDPMVSKLISDKVINNGELDFLVIEISEVQGWLGSLMKNHAYLMTKAVHPEVGVITNIAMDHIGLVNSIDEVYSEVSGVPIAIKNGWIVLNYDDKLVMKLNSFFNENTFPFFCSMSYLPFSDDSIYYDVDKKSIFYNDIAILKEEDLPFTSNHFIQNILSAIGCCITLEIPNEDIVKGIKSYKSLNRRFSKLNDKPLIIDDFAHNPDGIKATIKETAKLVPEGSKLYVVCSIRGSRGIDINQMNAKALAESVTKDTEVVLSSSNDVVNHLNFVEDSEREMFFSVLNENNIEFTHFDKLYDALYNTYKNVSNEDIILLIGAQGMDPAESILKILLK